MVLMHFNTRRKRNIDKKVDVNHAKPNEIMLEAAS